jgi:hypothetical protein
VPWPTLDAEDRADVLELLAEEVAEFVSVVA